LLGNHDIAYLKDSPFQCSGYRPSYAKGVQEILEEFICSFEPSAYVDGFIVTHAGITNKLKNDLMGKDNTDNHELFHKIQEEFKSFRTSRRTNKLFHVGRFRGGWHKYGGIFWADYRDEVYCDIPQVFGHSKVQYGKIKNIKNQLWAVGCDSDNRLCFNTTTKEVEEF